MKKIIAELLDNIVFRYNKYFFEEDVPEGTTNVWKTVREKLNLIIKDLREVEDEDEKSNT